MFGTISGGLNCTFGGDIVQLAMVHLMEVTEMATDETMFFDFDKLHEKNVKETLKTVYDALEEKGYNPINQIVGYLLSGDPAYIPRLNNGPSRGNHPH